MDAVQGGGAVARFFDREAGDCERGAKHPAQIVIVFDNQDTCAAGSCTSR